GIRDFHVTGVQTCALPICRHPHGDEVAWTRDDLLGGWRLELGPFEAVVYLDVRLERAGPPSAPAGDEPRGDAVRRPDDLPARGAARRRARTARLSRGGPRRRGGGSAGG